MGLFGAFQTKIQPKTHMIPEWHDSGIVWVSHVGKRF